MIETVELTKAYRKVRAVDGISFTARPGRVTGFLGLNGSGKTTTLRMLLGLTRPTGGDALINGKPYADLTHPLRQVGAVFEQGISHPGQSGRAHLVTQAMLAGASRTRVDALLEQVGLADDAHRRTGDYSLGMRRTAGSGTRHRWPTCTAWPRGGCGSAVAITSDSGRPSRAPAGRSPPTITPWRSPVCRPRRPARSPSPKAFRCTS